MSRWFRWYEGTTEDAKFRVVARNACVTAAKRDGNGDETGANASVTAANVTVTVRDVIALWAFILEDASKDDHRGECRRDVAFMAAVLDLDEATAARILTAMTKVGLVAIDGQAVTVCHWDQRQFETDRTDATNAVRQRRHREKIRGDDKTAAKRERNGAPNGHETATKRPDTEQSRTEQSRFKERKNPLPLKERKTANGSTRDARVWVVTDDPRWKHYAAAYSAEHGGKRPPTKGGLGGQGWYFAPLEGKR